MNTEHTTFGGLFDSVRGTLPYKVEAAIVSYTEQIAERLSMVGLTRTQFAEKLDASPAYVTKFMGGGTNFTLESMVKVADALDADVRIEVVPRYTLQAWIDVAERLNPTPSPALGVWSERRAQIAELGALDFIGPPALETPSVNDGKICHFQLAA